MKTHEEYMQMAADLATYGMDNGFGGPFGALIVHDGQIIGQGYNQVTSSNDPTAHGEVMAIRDATTKLGSFQLPAGSVMYTSCEPCPMCFGAIKWAGIETVYYGSTAQDAADINFSDADIYREIQTPNAQRKSPLIQIGRETTLLVFHKWAAKDDRIEY